MGLQANCRDAKLIEPSASATGAPIRARVQRQKGSAMNDHVHRGIDRRALVAGSLAGAAGLMLPQPTFAQEAPWAQVPKAKVDKVNFVVWTYGDIYTRISRQFEADWGVRVEGTISSFNDHPTKLTTMFAGGETIDVSQSSPFSFPAFVKQGLVEPLDGLPGADAYLKDFTSF